MGCTRNRAKRIRCLVRPWSISACSGTMWSRRKASSVGTSSTPWRRTGSGTVSRSPFASSAATRRRTLRPTGCARRAPRASGSSTGALPPNRAGSRCMTIRCFWKSTPISSKPSPRDMMVIPPWRSSISEASGCTAKGIRGAPPSSRVPRRSALPGSTWNCTASGCPIPIWSFPTTWPAAIQRRPICRSCSSPVRWASACATIR